MKGKPRFRSALQHWSAVLADVVLKWAYHDWLWHFVGLSAVLVHRDVLTKSYVDDWRAKGIPVVAWTVNDSLQRAYLEGHLGVATMSDTMDRVPVADLVRAKDLNEGER